MIHPSIVAPYPSPMTSGGRLLASPAFPYDDGRPDEELRQRLHQPTPDLVEILRSSRLLIAIVARLEQADDDGALRSGDEEISHMAVVSMVNERGQKGLLAFTGLDSMLLWDPRARPVPALGSDIGRAAQHDGALAVVIDISGPSRFLITGADLEHLASLA